MVAAELVFYRIATASRSAGEDRPREPESHQHFAILRELVNLCTSLQLRDNSRARN